MYTLGISAYSHDSSAALLKDTSIVAAAQEERFSRIKNDSNFPSQSVEYCLKMAGIKIHQLDAVVFHEKYFLNFERIINTYLSFSPFGFENFITSLPIWLKSKLNLKEKILAELKNKFNGDLENKLFFSNHHLSHAASAFYPSPFCDAAILTVDGVGENITTTISSGCGANIELLRKMTFPHSWGLFYSAITSALGFNPNNDEYKVMGLASYGNPTASRTKLYYELINANVLSSHSDGSVSLNLDYFSFTRKNEMIYESIWKEKIGFKVRKKFEPINQNHADFAYACQKILEEGIIKLCNTSFKLTGHKNIVLAGGVALNCVANARIKRESPFNNVWIQPAAGDSGCALGAAYAYLHLHKGHPRNSKNEDMMNGSFLGPQYSDDEILEAIKKNNLHHYAWENSGALLSEVSQLLYSDQIIGWFQGRMEWGPRALGNRSILASPFSKNMKSILNDKIKLRENFRPFAPAVLAEDFNLYFESDTASPYMQMISHLKKEWLLASGDLSNVELSEKVNIPRSIFPSVTHFDGTCRAQVVNKNTNSVFWELINQFKKNTGVGVLLNTSFNLNNEPIVCSPQDAISCFLRSEIDVLVLNNFIIKK